MLKASSATLLQCPSFALNDMHGHHYHVKQNLISTSSTLFVGHSRGFRVNSTKGKAPTPASATRRGATRIVARLSLPAYLTSTLGLSEAEALSASRHLLGWRKQNNIHTFITIKKTGDAISYLQNECELGLSLSEIRTLVVKYPKILSPGADLRKTCTPNITLLQNDFGFTKEKVHDLLFKFPRAFLLETEMLKDRLVKIEDKWGISRDSGSFLSAIPVFCGVTDEKVKARCLVFKSFGWSDCDIVRLIKASPNCIAYKEARIRKSLEFCMNELGYEPAYLATRSTLLINKVETRVLPRHRVLSVLKENLLIKSSYQLISCITMPDDKFEEKFILPYEKLVPNIRQLYNEGRTPNNEAEAEEEASEDESDH